MRLLSMILLVSATLTLSTCYSAKKIVPQSSTTITKSLDDNLLILRSLDSVSGVNANLICDKYPIPTILKQLNQRDIYTSNVTLSVGASLSAFGFSGSFSKNDVLVAAYLIAYKDYPCDTTTRRMMAGIKLYVHATDVKASFSSPTLPMVAAAVQLGLAKSEYRFQIFGLNPNNIYANLPSASFDVDTYSKVISSYDNIVHSLGDSTAIDPIYGSVSPNGAITIGR